MNPRKQALLLMLSIFIFRCFCPSAAPKAYMLGCAGVFVIFNIAAFVYSAGVKYIGLPRLIAVSKREHIKTGREFGMDIVRILAILFVPFIHFFGNAEYYTCPLEGKTMLYATVLRWLVLTAVPLFMIITGYFKIYKQADFAHYKSIFPILATHIVICAIRLWTDANFHQIELTREYVTDKLLYFNYGWYVRLYIGLTLIIPFLNKCWAALSSRAQKENLIVTLLILTSMGPLVYDIIPATWLALYVPCYYFIGAYIKEYKIKINPILNILLIGAALYITSAATVNQANGGVFDWSYLGYLNNSGYSSLPAFIISALIVILLSDLKCGIKPIAAAAGLISSLSLEMYLFSQMFDSIIYKPYQLERWSFPQYLPIAPSLLVKIIVCAFAASLIKKVIFGFLELYGKAVFSDNTKSL